MPRKQKAAPESALALPVKRPMPPEGMGEDEFEGFEFQPGPDVVMWLYETFLSEESPLFNEQHKHLRGASIGVLWTDVIYSKQMNRVAATAEIPSFRANAWGKGRQEMQMRQWFGQVPDFLITIDARLARQMSDAQWCAVVEHELYHCAQAVDAFGAPRFNMQTGAPIFAIKGHDVEEFVGVVERYGVGNAAGKTAALVKAANAKPLFGEFEISHCCGTCG
jgi:hypothetical protein